MSHLMQWFEPEEFIGSRWHGLTRGRASLERHAESAVAFEQVAGALPVFHRALGGAAAMRFAAVTETTSQHRLARGLRLMLGEEKIACARREDGVVLLPSVIDAFRDRAMNRRLYFWLAGFFVHMRPPHVVLHDPLARDVDYLHRAAAATSALLAAVPGFRPVWTTLSAALLASRPRRPLPEHERAVEGLICGLLANCEDIAPPLFQARMSVVAPRGYRSFLPVLAWGDAQGAVSSGNFEAAPDEEAGAGKSCAADSKARNAKRREAGETERKDYIALNRFEKLLSLVESLDINRAVEDDDEDGARKALDDAEEVSLSKHSRKAATRLRADLVLDGAAQDGRTLHQAEFPEWDYRTRQLVPGRVRIHLKQRLDEAEPPINAERARLHAQVRRQFEAFRPKPETLRARIDGNELDMDAVVRNEVDLRSSGAADARIYMETRRRNRDMSVAILADASLSTESWLDGCRVLDVEQEALAVLSQALTACGDEHAIYSFTSRRRERVEIGMLKSFDENFGPHVERRIFGLKPGWYTRMGAAIRYAAREIVERQHAHRLVIVLTDGKPNDIDHYEGRFGIEDTRHAVQEARRAGITVFGITVDAKGQDYFPTLFGQGGYAIVQQAGQLPSACLSIYRKLTLR
ncbi:MAG: protein norD [Hyphomicrobiales bacterium]|nr:protein norD [Hyphomicrobiales bacterium]